MIRNLLPGLLLCTLLSMGHAYGRPSSKTNECPAILLVAQQKAQGLLDAMDASAARAALALASSGLTGRTADTELGNLYSNHQPYVINTATINATGTMVNIFPQAYAGYVGSDLSDQSEVIRIIQSQKPFLSDMFTSVEGRQAVVLEWPVLTTYGQYLGSLSILTDPVKLFDTVITALPETEGSKFYVMQDNGYMLYNTRKSEIGRNVFVDAPFTDYPEVEKLAHQITEKPAGCHGPYRFTGNTSTQTVEKMNCWRPTGLHETRWRLGLSWDCGEIPASIVVPAPVHDTE